VVLLLCWAKPLSLQFFGDGPGNLSELVASSSDSGTTVGPRLGTRLTARILTEPPFFLRPSFHDGWISSRSVVVAPRAANVPRLPFAVGSLVVLGAVLLALAWGARRRGDRPLLLLQATALLAVAMALATAIRAPRGYFGVPMHLYRWLWAVSAFAFLAVLLALVRRLPPRSLPAATMVLTIGVGILAVANLPTSDQGTIAPPGSIAAVEELNEQLGPLEGSGPYLVDVPERFNDPYGSAVMAELQDRGIPFRVQEGWERQVGPQRLLEAGGAEAALRVVTGDAARMPGPDADRVAFHDGLVPGERRDLEAAWADLAAAARAGELRLDQGGRAALAREELPWWQDRYDDRGLQQLRVTRGVLKLVEEDWLDVDPSLQRTVDRFADLQDRSDDLTVAVLREPLTPEEQRGQT